MNKLSGAVISLLQMSTFAEAAKVALFQSNNQTIEVDEYLNFTWSTDKIYTNELYGLVPKKDEEDDELVEVLFGHFELENFQSEEGDKNITIDTSFRFCMQYYKQEFDDQGNDISDPYGGAFSKRTRVRFFNKRAAEYLFYPQLAVAEDGLIGGVNPDHFRTRGPGCFANGSPLEFDDPACTDIRDQDDLKTWCTTEYAPKDTNGVLDASYVAETDEEKDTHGIGVLKTIIDATEKKTKITFMRPMVSQSLYDTDLVAGETYGLYINYGVFDDMNDNDNSKVRGHKDPLVPLKMEILVALLANKLILSVASLTFSVVLSM